MTDVVLDGLSGRDIDVFVRGYAENAKIETGDGETLAFGHAEMAICSAGVLEVFGRRRLDR